MKNDDDAITTSSYFRHIEGESCPCCVHAMKRYNGLIMGTILAQLGSFSRRASEEEKTSFSFYIVNSIMENRY